MNNYRNNFLDWFIGFAEGNGSWQVENKPMTKRVIFVINQQYPSVLYKIKKQLKFGTITGPYINKVNNSQYYLYRVSKIRDIKTLIDIFNGKLVLNKTKIRFKNFVNFYNSLSAVENSSDEVCLIENLVLPTLQDSWLSGFIDAEGTFSGYVKKRKAEISGIVLVFSLMQKSEDKLFCYLKSLLKGSLDYQRGKDVWCLKLEAVNDRKRLIIYLDRFPLWSNKNISFVRFKKLHVRLTDGKYKWRLTSVRAKERLIRLVKNINKF